MLEEMLLPLHLHYDYGFTAMAGSFERIAKEASEVKSGDFNRHIPIAFLLRHSVELYLKSTIVVLNCSISMS